MNFLIFLGFQLLKTMQIMNQCLLGKIFVYIGYIVFKIKLKIFNSLKL